LGIQIAIIAYMQSSFQDKLSIFQRHFATVFKSRCAARYLKTSELTITKTSKNYINELFNFVLQDAKRIRPFLLFLGADRISHLQKTKTDKLWDIAICIELTHAGMLIHDDIIDKSAKRRGKIALHKKIGESKAIVTGDMAWSLGIHFLQNSKCVLEDKEYALSEFLNSTVACGLGQLLDIEFEKRKRVSQKDILRMYELKSADFGFAMPLILGAIFSGKKELIQPYRKIGKLLGSLFQLKDDIADRIKDKQSVLKKFDGDLQKIGLKLYSDAVFAIEESAIPKSIKNNLLQLSDHLQEGTT
jgi:geranylgeranyl pyrophosphate synthase